MTFKSSMSISLWLLHLLIIVLEYWWLYHCEYSINFLICSSIILISNFMHLVHKFPDKIMMWKAFTCCPSHSNLAPKTLNLKLLFPPRYSENFFSLISMSIDTKFFGGSHLWLCCKEILVKVTYDYVVKPFNQFASYLSKIDFLELH